MIDIQQLNERHSIPGILTFEKRDNNFVFLNISNQLADSSISLYGAQITSFRPKNELDILWMSPASNFLHGKAIRGGIPVCFPWFGPHKTDPGKPQHGFGRLMSWEVAETAHWPSGETFIRLELLSSDFTRSYWPHSFVAEMIIVAGKALTATLKVTNTSSVPFDYSCALHTYYNISAIEKISISGLEGAGYYRHDEAGEFIQDSSTLLINEMVDRHYYDTVETCVISDPVYNRKIHVAKAGSSVTTVWNPWIENCTKIGDMPDDGYKTFVCIEAVNSFGNTIVLNPGESHETSAIIGLED